MTKVGRNEPCSCGSGQKYKYCCRGLADKVRKPHVDFSQLDAEATEQFKATSTRESAEHERLRYFCKDNGFYYFKNRNEADYLTIQRKLLNGSLEKEDFLRSYRAHTTLELVSTLLSIAYKQSDAFAQRKGILNSAVNAHFNNQYELSIPALFIVIEGVLRDIGGLNLKDKFKPTMTDRGLEEQLLYTVVDSLGYFNSFVTNLFKGSQQAEEFNRNTILHGANNSCFNEDNSLILLLTVLEIQDYVFYQNSWPPKIEVRNGVRVLSFPNT